MDIHNHEGLWQTSSISTIEYWSLTILGLPIGGKAFICEPVLRAHNQWHLISRNFKDLQICACDLQPSLAISNALAVLLR